MKAGASAPAFSVIKPLTIAARQSIVLAERRLTAVSRVQFLYEPAQWEYAFEMKKSFHAVYISVMSALFVLMFSREAWAYIDPGSGSFIIQMIIGALCGMLFALKIFWKQVKYFFSNLFTRRQKEENEKE